jgi:hypothetical protein
VGETLRAETEAFRPKTKAVRLPETETLCIAPEAK